MLLSLVDGKDVDVDGFSIRTVKNSSVNVINGFRQAVIDANPDLHTRTRQPLMEKKRLEKMTVLFLA